MSESVPAKSHSSSKSFSIQEQVEMVKQPHMLQTKRFPRNTEDWLHCVTAGSTEAWEQQAELHLKDYTETSHGRRRLSFNSGVLGKKKK